MLVQSVEPPGTVHNHPASPVCAQAQHSLPTHTHTHSCTRTHSHSSPVPNTARIRTLCTFYIASHTQHAHYCACCRMLRGDAAQCFCLHHRPTPPACITITFYHSPSRRATHKTRTHNFNIQSKCDISRCYALAHERCNLNYPFRRRALRTLPCVRVR